MPGPTRSWLNSTAASRGIRPVSRLACANEWRLHHMAQKLHIGGQADDVGLRQRRVQPGQRLLARVAVHDELGHHGVVKRADGVALAHAVVKAHRR